MMIWIFWGSLFLILYSYLLFPLILMGLVRVTGKRDHAGPGELPEHPRVAVLCAMYNEEKVAREKIENFLQLDYDRTRLYVGSDGSSDATSVILNEYADNDRIVIHEFPRRGKVYVINDLMAEADEEVIVFTDANSMFQPNAITKLVGHFRNPRIGAVCGRLQLMSSGRMTGEGFYWRYETAIKKLESRLECVIGANGAIYAVLKKLLRPLPATTINDDFTNSMRVIEQGYGVTYAEDALACEEVYPDDSVEFRRHVRDGAGHYRALACLYKLLNPLKFKIFFLYVSHRVIRWLVPFLMIVLLAAPLFIPSNPLVHAAFAAEIALYILVMATWLTKSRNKFLYFPFYFVYINLALFIGFWRTVLGVQKASWESTER